MTDYTIKRVIRELEELEYLDVKRSAQGGSFRYRLAATHTAPAIFDGLTSPQELRGKAWSAVARRGEGDWNSGTKVEHRPKSEE